MFVQQYPDRRASSIYNLPEKRKELRIIKIFLACLKQSSLKHTAAAQDIVFAAQTSHSWRDNPALALILKVND